MTSPLFEHHTGDCSGASLFSKPLVNLAKKLTPTYFSVDIEIISSASPTLPDDDSLNSPPSQVPKEPPQLEYNDKAPLAQLSPVSPAPQDTIQVPSSPVTEDRMCCLENDLDARLSLFM